MLYAYIWVKNDHGPSTRVGEADYTGGEGRKAGNYKQVLVSTWYSKLQNKETHYMNYAIFNNQTAAKKSTLTDLKLQFFHITMNCAGGGRDTVCFSGNCNHQIATDQSMQFGIHHLLDAIIAGITCLDGKQSSPNSV